MNISICFQESDRSPIAHVNPSDPGHGPFIVLDLTPDVSIFLRGYGRESVQHAREIIVTLEDAIALLEPSTPASAANIEEAAVRDVDQQGAEYHGPEF